MAFLPDAEDGEEQPRKPKAFAAKHGAAPNAEIVIPARAGPTIRAKLSPAAPRPRTFVRFSRPTTERTNFALAGPATQREGSSPQRCRICARRRCRPTRPESPTSPRKASTLRGTKATPSAHRTDRQPPRQTSRRPHADQIHIGPKCQPLMPNGSIRAPARLGRCSGSRSPSTP